MEEYNYSFASIDDETSIRSLLTECNLPHEDILAANLINYILAKHRNEIIGIVGLEIFNESGLLRSLCVKTSYRRNNIGKKLY